jgi:N-acetylglucosamine-6-sulfatase
MSRPSVGPIVVPLCLAGAVACGKSAPSALAPAAPSAAARPKPNVILIVTDDMNARDLPSMPQVTSLLGGRGTTFSHAYVTASVCAPSRASILTGQYPHNHGGLTNDIALSALSQPGGPEGSTLATWFHAAGYRTVLLGKYLNHYSRMAGYVPPGWDEWNVPVPENTYFTYSLVTKDGSIPFGAREQDYEADVLARRAVDFISRAAEEPFFMYIAPVAPHLPAQPAPRHSQLFRDAQVDTSTCAFSAADLLNKPDYVRQRRTPLTDAEIALINHIHRRRLGSLQAVDDMAAAILRALAGANVLDRTVIAFTSDNGWEQGQHRFMEGKNLPYEESILVPLVIAGPGIAHQAVEAVVGTIDLAPTFLEMAGLGTSAPLDGRSLVPLLGGATPSDWRSAVLVQSHDQIRGEAGPFFEIRTDRWMYTEYQDGERELYDMQTDPDQCSNAAAQAPPALLDQLARQLQRLSACRGSSCS